MLLATWDFDSASRLQAKQCRREFAAMLRHRGGPTSDFDAAELIFGELIANVVRHAPGRVSIRLELSGKYPTLIVHDEEDAFAVDFTPPRDLLQETGRGLFIIHQLAVSMEVEDVPNDGTKVIVELPILI